MNTNTGAIYELGEDFADKVNPSFQYPNFEAMKARAEFMSEIEKRDGAEALKHPTAEQAEARLGRGLTEDESAALTDIARGDSIIPVSEQVAHTMGLGQRELDRRRRRRKAAKQARKQNRTP